MKDLFSLRNRGRKECVQELGHNLIHDDRAKVI
jgi:hypothetical protein